MEQIMLTKANRSLYVTIIHQLLSEKSPEAGGIAPSVPWGSILYCQSRPFSQYHENDMVSACRYLKLFCFIKKLLADCILSKAHNLL